MLFMAQYLTIPERHYIRVYDTSVGSPKPGKNVLYPFRPVRGFACALPDFGRWPRIAGLRFVTPMEADEVVI